MSPIDPDDAQTYYRAGGRFFNPSKELNLGESITVELVSIDKQFKTQYPIKDKSYCYRLSFTDATGEARILDMNGADLIRQVAVALYPNGPDAPMVPCRARISRRTERRKTQSELVVERVKEPEKIQ